MKKKKFKIKRFLNLVIKTFSKNNKYLTLYLT